MIIEAYDLTAIVATADGLKGLAFGKRFTKNHFAGLLQTAFANAETTGVGSGHIMPENAFS